MQAIIKLLATGFGAGYIKPGPGTWGSLMAVLLAYFFNISLYIIFLGIIIGIFICQRAEEYFNEHDCSKIVWDEVVGMWIALFTIPTVFYPLAFVLFRFFDITKIFPINRLDNLPGGLGIMLDDVMAGIFARITIGIIIYILTGTY